MLYASCPSEGIALVCLLFVPDLVSYGPLTPNAPSRRSTPYQKDSHHVVLCVSLFDFQVVASLLVVPIVPTMRHSHRIIPGPSPPNIARPTVVTCVRWNSYVRMVPQLVRMSYHRVYNMVQSKILITHGPNSLRKVPKVVVPVSQIQVGVNRRRTLLMVDQRILLHAAMM